jgi:prepilin-type processing-associated H-X9-DG protein
MATGSDRGLIGDQLDNHDDYGNVLYDDGHVQPISNVEWAMQTNIPGCLAYQIDPSLGACRLAGRMSTVPP